MNRLDKSRPNSKQVLLVEDGRTSNGSLRLALIQFGFQVLEAETVEDAAGLIQSRRLPIDAAVIDLISPEFCGRELADELRTSTASVPIVFISANSWEFLHDCGILQLEDTFFQKPFYPGEVAAALYELLGLQRPFRVSPRTVRLAGSGT